jgi:ABC-type bacteriocin/lantibiotic exporter with double-glycine peptidase domain
VLIFIGVFFEILGISILIPIINFLSTTTQSNYLNFYAFKLNVARFSKELVVFYYFIGIFIFYSIKFLFFYFLNKRQSKFISSLNKWTSLFFYEKYLNEDYETHLEKNPNKLIFNIQTEVSLFVDIIKSKLFLYSEIAVIISMILILFLVQPLGTISISMFLFISSYIYALYQKKSTKTLGEKKQKYDILRYRFLTEGINGYKELVIHDSSKKYINSFLEYNNKFSESTSKFYFLSQISKTFLEFISIIGLVLLVFVLLFLKIDLTQIVSILGIFLLVAFRLLPSGNRIISSIQAIRYGLPTINLIAFELSNKENKSNNSFSFETNSKAVTNNQSLISISNLSFKYNNTDKLILDNISFQINKGETIGIMGKSGSGKSTLINILLCLLNPTNGNIFTNGISIFDNPKKWRENIGYVPQNIFLIDDSIQNNIAFGLSENEIDTPKLNKSIEIAQLSEYINSLPNGINTNVGDRGIKISGGQRQRIGIARALYNDPEIIVLDEATSALDSETEKDFMNIVYEMKKSKTMIIITHRPSTLYKADRIYEFINGKFSQQNIK